MLSDRMMTSDKSARPSLVRFFLFLLIEYAGTVVCAPAGAQTVDALKFQAYITSSAYHAKVEQAIATISPDVFQKCQTLQSPGSKVILLKSVEFGSDSTPSSGSWVNRFPVTGCGNDTILNIYFTVTSDGKNVDSFVGLPGSTIASLVLQRDTKLSVVAGFSALVPGCKTVPNIKNTHFEGFGIKNAPIAPPKAGEKPRAWWEIWTMSGCGHVAEVPINFVTDATGTKFFAMLNDIAVH